MYLSAKILSLVTWLLIAQGVLAVQPPSPEQLPPVPPSPIDQFRGWLKLNAPERQQALSEWPEPKRAVILARLKTYEALPADERERRLRMLELRWYMRPLMNVPAEERSAGLAMIPPRLQRIVAERLAQWDALDSETRKNVIENERVRELVTSYFSQFQQGRGQKPLLSSLDADRQRELRHALETWNRTTPEEQQKMAEQLAGFFELPKKEQERTLGELTESERQEMQATLEAFARLSPEQRRVCVDSFQKFTRFTPQERVLFLRNAARWQRMTPEERQTWKQLVTKLPPLPSEPTPLPPRPEGGEARIPSVATNAQY
jgi:hypothetical protein